MTGGIAIQQVTWGPPVKTPTQYRALNTIITFDTIITMQNQKPPNNCYPNYFRESEAALEDVTRSIQQSFTESSPPGCTSSEHVQQQLLSPSASVPKPSLVEQIMTQMDQVFTELLKEEVGEYMQHQLYFPIGLFPRKTSGWYLKLSTY